MQLLLACGIALFGTAISFGFPRGDARKWAFGVTAWLSLPLGFIIEPVLGFRIAEIAGCAPSAAKEIECFINGWDISGWMNGLVFSGYGIAFVAVPWFLFGGFCVIVAWIVYAFRN